MKALDNVVIPNLATKEDLNELMLIAQLNADVHPLTQGNDGSLGGLYDMEAAADLSGYITDTDLQEFTNSFAGTSGKDLCQITGSINSAVIC